MAAMDEIQNNNPYEIPFDDTPPEDFVKEGKELVDSRMVEKIFDNFIETLTEATVYEGALKDHLDEDTMELGADWVIGMVMRRFGYEWKGIPSEYRAGMGLI